MDQLQLTYEQKLLISIANHFELGNFDALQNWLLSSPTQNLSLDYMLYAQLRYFRKNISIALYQKSAITKAFLQTDERFCSVIDISKEKPYLVFALQQISPFANVYKTNYVQHFMTLYLTTPSIGYSKSIMDYQVGNLGVDRLFEVIISTIGQLVRIYNDPELSYIISHVNDGSLID